MKEGDWVRVLHGPGQDLVGRIAAFYPHPDLLGPACICRIEVDVPHAGTFKSWTDYVRPASSVEALAALARETRSKA